MPGPIHSYLRISAARDGDIETLESQRQTCQRLAAEHGREISKEWNEGSVMSVRSGSQPVLQELLSSVGSGDVLVTREVSRLTRNRHTTGQLRQLVADGVRVLTPQLDTADPAVLLSFALFAEPVIAENEDKSARVRAEQDPQRRASEFMGGVPPWGFQAVGDTSSSMRRLLPKRSARRRLSRGRVGSVPGEPAQHRRGAISSRWQEGRLRPDQVHRARRARRGWRW